MRINEFSINVGLVFLLALAMVVNQKEFLIALAVIATIPVLKSAIESIRNKEISIDLLASFALIVSMIEGQWSSVAFINLMITSARIFEVYIENKAKKALESLTKLRPQKVKLINGEKVAEVGIEQIREGDKILIETGDRIAVDGEVISGSAAIDQSSLTGESLPINKGKRDKVFCSTLNISGSLIVKTEKVGKETSFQKIIDLVEKANQVKEGVNSVISKFTTGYIILTAIACGVIWFLTKNITLLLSLLLVTCADDIAVAIPLVYWGAIAIAAKKGVIVKSGLNLEILKKVNILVVDKTGTLTKGEIRVQHTVVFGQVKEDEAIKIAASIAGVSSHPIAKSIVNFAKEKNINFELMQKFEEIPGEGIEAADNKNRYFLGGIKAVIKRKNKLTRKETEEYKKLQDEGHNLLFLFKNKKLLALFGLADQLKPGILESVAELKKNGIEKIVMLTGDNEVVAKNITQKTGLDEYESDLMPEEKLNYVDKEISNGKIVAYVGDGVNDAAGLARANVGIAMGAIGTDAAIEAADIALMNDNFEKINEMINLSRRLGKIVVGNFAIWGTVNLVGLILVFGFKINPEVAAAYNFVTDFIPLLNSIRIFRDKI